MQVCKPVLGSCKPESHWQVCALQRQVASLSIEGAKGVSCSQLSMFAWVSHNVWLKLGNLAQFWSGTHIFLLHLVSRCLQILSLLSLLLPDDPDKQDITPRTTDSSHVLGERTTVTHATLADVETSVCRTQGTWSMHIWTPTCKYSGTKKNELSTKINYRFQEGSNN